MILLAVTATDRDGPARRREIMEVVDSEPGIHKSELQRRTGLGWGTITYHVEQLEQQGRVHSVHWRGRAVLVPASVAPEHVEWLLALREPQRRDVLSALDDPFGRGIEDLCDDLDLSRKVIRTHLSVLDDVGLVERSPRPPLRFWAACGSDPTVLDRLVRRWARQQASKDPMATDMGPETS